jgi:hypothetical protein
LLLDTLAYQFKMMEVRHGLFKKNSGMDTDQQTNRSYFNP